MKPLRYIIVKSFKNGLKELVRKPSKLILYIVIIAFFALMIAVSMLNTNAAKSTLDKELFGSIVTGVILLFTLPDLFSSLNSGGSFFRSADVNLTFTAPIKPQKVLIYGFIKQAYTALISVFFILFQLPNLYRHSNVKSYAGILIVVVMFTLILTNSLIKLLLYSYAAKSEKNRYRVKTSFKFLIALFVMTYALTLYRIKSPLEAVTAILNHRVVQYIPVYGWFRAAFMASVNGVTVSTMVYMTLIIVFISLCMYVLYATESDYYEDVLAATDLKEQALEAMKTGQRVNLNTGKKSWARKVQYKKKGQGASAIFYRHMLEYSKTGYGFLNIASLIYIVAAFSIGLFMPFKELNVVLGISVYMLFIFSFSGKWEQELSKPYVYSLPDSSFKKVVYSTAVDNLKNLLDGSLLFIITGIFFGSSPLRIVFSIAAYVSIGALFIYGGVLTRRIVGATKNIIVHAFMRMGVLLLIVLPSLILLGIFSTLLAGTLGEYIGVIIFIAYNLVFSSIIIFLSKGIFENIELN